MVNITISVSDSIKNMLERHPEINWSEVARQAWVRKVSDLELLDRLTAKSRASETGIQELAKLLRKGVAEKHGKK